MNRLSRLALPSLRTGILSSWTAHSSKPTTSTLLLVLYEVCIKKKTHTHIIRCEIEDSIGTHLHFSYCGTWFYIDTYLKLFRQLNAQYYIIGRCTPGKFISGTTAWLQIFALSVGHAAAHTRVLLGNPWRGMAISEWSLLFWWPSTVGGLWLAPG